MTANGVKVARHAAESGHWYTRNGEQVVEVTGAKGQPVRPNLRHARKHDWAPGVTTIIGQARSYQLERWKIRQSVLAALTLPREPGETDAEYTDRIDADAREQAKAAAERGTAIHAAIQRYADSGLADAEWFPWLDAVHYALGDVGIAVGGDWHAEVPCVSDRGYGTKADLVIDGWLLDFKTKDAIDDRTKPYDEHAMQLAATREALRDSTRHEVTRCGIVFLTREAPVRAAIHEIDDEGLDRGWDCFAALLAYWQAKNRHHPWQRTTP